MYCRIYVNPGVNLYDTVRSVIPCDKLHKHQFSFNNDGPQRASFGWELEFQYGGNFSVSWGRNFEIFLDSRYHASDKFSS